MIYYAYYVLSKERVTPFLVGCVVCSKKYIYYQCWVSAEFNMQSLVSLPVWLTSLKTLPLVEVGRRAESLYVCFQYKSERMPGHPWFNCSDVGLFLTKHDSQGWG